MTGESILNAYYTGINLFVCLVKYKIREPLSTDLHKCISGGGGRPSLAKSERAEKWS